MCRLTLYTIRRQVTGPLLNLNSQRFGQMGGTRTKVMPAVAAHVFNRGYETARMVSGAMITHLVSVTFKVQGLQIWKSAFSSSLIAAALFALESSLTTPAGTTVLAKTTFLRVGLSETTETSSRDETCEDKFIKKIFFIFKNKKIIGCYL